MLAVFTAEGLEDGMEGSRGFIQAFQTLRISCNPRCPLWLAQPVLVNSFNRKPPFYLNSRGLASVPLGSGICSKADIVGASWVIIVLR